VLFIKDYQFAVTMVIRTELIALAHSLKVELPVWYLDLVDDFGGKPWSEEKLWASIDMIHDMNKGFRSDGAWGCEWREQY
jgi:hypothetical protein